MADGSALLEGLQLGPLGLPVRVTTDDPDGMGDRSSLLGDTVYIPSRDPASVPHETMHANIRRLEGAVPGGMLAEGLFSRLAESAYGDRAQYLNPFERVAYGYQEGVTGQPDTRYQKTLAEPRGSSGVMTLRAIMDALGKGAEVGGRALGRFQRPKR